MISFSRIVKIISLLILAGIMIYAGFVSQKTENIDTNINADISSTEEVVPAPVRQSAYPESNDVLIAVPLPGTMIESPFQIAGLIRGTWLFEANAPLILTDWDGRIIAEGYITAQGDWMTEDLVPFSGELSFVRPDYGDRGTVIIQKANPSDLPQYDNAYEFTIALPPLLSE